MLFLKLQIRKTENSVFQQSTRCKTRSSCRQYLINLVPHVKRVLEKYLSEADQRCIITLFKGVQCKNSMQKLNRRKSKSSAAFRK